MFEKLKYLLIEFKPRIKCKKCEIGKYKEEFYWRRSGLISCYTCKECSFVQNKKYLQTDKGRELRRKNQTVYVKTDRGKEVKKKTSAKYKKTDKGKVSQAKYDKSDKGRASSSKYAKSDKGKAATAKHAKTKKGKASIARYDKSDKGKATRVRSKAKRRAREKDIVNTLTGEQWNQILSDQGYICNGCHKPFSEEKPATADHIKPVCDGGGTTKENIQGLCNSCNCIKGARPMSYLIERLKNDSSQNGI